MALAQFISSFAGSNMNVMINDISEDLDTTVQGVQVPITLFLLVIALIIVLSRHIEDPYAAAMITLAVIGLVGLLAAVRLPEAPEAVVGVDAAGPPRR